MKTSLTGLTIKILLLLVLVVFISPTLSAQIDTAKPGPSGSRYQIQLDTLKVQAISANTPKSLYESSAMPWIIALFVGGLTVIANILISFYTRKTSIAIAKKQIESASSNAISQFHFTLNAKNRQDWINDVRNCISEFITQCNLINIEFQEEQQNDALKKQLHEKITFNRNKLRLLISAHLKEHADFLEAMKDLVNELDRHMLNNRHDIEDYDNLGLMQKSDKVIDAGRALLYAEWQKIQSAKPLQP